MAIDFGNLQMRLNPLSPINIGGGDGMEAERLRLAQEQFEEQKRNNELDRKMQARAAQAAAAQAKLQREDQQKATAAAAAQKLRDERLAAYQKFTELNGGGDIEGARAMVPMMSALGMGVDLRGEEHGLPVYAIEMDAEKAAADAARGQAQQTEQESQAWEQGAHPLYESMDAAAPPDESAEASLARLGGMGFPTDETGNLDDPQMPDRDLPTGDLTIDPAAGDVDAGVQDAITPGPDDIAPVGDEDTVTVGAGGLQPAILPGQDAYLRALGARQHFEATGEPVRKPDEEDFTGAVPKNVLDTGAIHQQTLARLNPALQGFVGAYPEEYRDSAGQTAEAVRGLGLPAAKSLEMADKLRSSPDSLIKSQLENDAKVNDRESLKRMEREALYDKGYANGDKVAKTFAIGDVIERRKTTAQALAVLTNKEDSDDYMAGASVSRLMGERGATTEGDISRVLGTAAQSFLDRIKARLYKEAVGGLSPGQKNALIGVLKKSEETDVARAHDFLSNIDDALANPGMDPERARGLRDYRNVIIPRDIRDGYQSTRKSRVEADGGSPRPVGGQSAELSDFAIELESQAMENDLDPDKLGPIIRGESGGKSKAVSSEGARGVMQIMPANLRAMGIDPDEYGKLSAVEQLPAVFRFLKDQGITADSTADEYAMAVAASDPKYRNAPDETVIYKKGSDEWKANEPWRPADGGDITRGSILAYYGLRPKRGSTGVTSVGAAPKAKIDADILGLLE